MSLWRRKGASKADPRTYSNLRALALGLTSEQVGLPDDQELIALMMESGLDGGVATLVAVADGTVSLYLSSGGGVIGAGEHPSVRETARHWLDFAAPLIEELQPVEDPAPPPEGTTQFVAVTATGVRSSVPAPDDRLGSQEDSYGALFRGGHDVITAIRLTST
jgi:hypothetical protein